MVEVREWSRSDTARLLRVPSADDDKYSRGVVALRTGSTAYPGAAVLGVEAAWRAGAGFVRFVGEQRVADAVLARRPETVTGSDVGRTRVDCWVVGSGTDAADRSAEDETEIRDLLTGTSRVVMDAGGLDLVDRVSAPVLITPHAGEFAKLRERLRLPAAGADRAPDAREVATALGVTVLLKGSRTLIAAPDGGIIALAAGTGWLATAGTGDVLGGVLGAVLAANPHVALPEAAAAGAWLHGYAARLASGTENGEPGHPIVALDVAQALPRAIADVLA